MQLYEATARRLQAGYLIYKVLHLAWMALSSSLRRRLGTYQRVLFSRTSGATRCTIPSTARFWAMTTTSMLTGRGQTMTPSSGPPLLASNQPTGVVSGGWGLGVLISENCITLYRFLKRKLLRCMYEYARQTVIACCILHNISILWADKVTRRLLCLLPFLSSPRKMRNWPWFEPTAIQPGQREHQHLKP
jgi:hypothetical protein